MWACVLAHCCAVISQNSGRALPSCDGIPAEGTGSTVTLEEEPVKAGVDELIDGCARRPYLPVL